MREDVRTDNPFTGSTGPKERDVFDDPNLVKDDNSGDKNTEDKDDAGDENQEDETPDETEETDETELNEEETDEEENKEEDEEEEEEEEEDELTDEEKELAESDQVYQRIKKEFPDAFKKIPELKQIVFREQRYTEVFPSPELAEKAAERLSNFAKFESEIVSGKPSGLIKSLEGMGKDKLHTFLGNFLPSVLKEAGKDAYVGMIYPAIKQVLRAAKESGNEVLLKSAMNINQFLFNNTDLDKHEGFVPKDDSEVEDAVSKREREFQERQFAAFAEDVVDIATKSVRNLTLQALKGSNISNLTQRKIAEEVFERVDAAIQRDKRFQGQLQHQWDQAKRAGFTSRWKDSISHTYLSRAKLLIPSIRLKVVKEFGVSLKELPKNGEKNRHVPPTSAIRTGKKKINESNKDDISKLSDREILDRM